MKEQCVNNPDNINWVEFWQEKLLEKKDKNKDWDKAAKSFNKRAKRDDYHEALFNNLILDENDVVLDLGCGEGSITIPLSKKVKKVIGVDSSVKMLEILNEKCEKENITNVETILMPIEDISYEEIGEVDVVLASRSLNGIIPIEETLKIINKIANKYVFITLFGPDNWKIENEFFKYIGQKQKSFPGHNYLFNILYNMGIYTNVTHLDIEEYREYNNIEEAMDNGKFRIDLMNDVQKEKLKEYLKKILKKDSKTGKLYNTLDKPDWVLLWWKKNKNG